MQKSDALVVLNARAKSFSEDYGEFLKKKLVDDRTKFSMENSWGFQQQFTPTGTTPVGVGFSNLVPCRPWICFVQTSQGDSLPALALDSFSRDL